MTKLWSADLESALANGAIGEDGDFCWPIRQDEYDSISRLVLDALEDTYLDGGMDEATIHALGISATDVAAEYCYFLSAALEFDHSRTAGLRLAYSPAISPYLAALDQDAIPALIGERTQATGRPAHAVTVGGRLKRIAQRAVLRSTATIGSARVYRVARNRLLMESSPSRSVSLEPWLNESFGIPKGIPAAVDTRIRDVVEALVLRLERGLADAGRELGTERRQFLADIGTAYVTAAAQDLRRPVSGHVNMRSSVLIVGSAGSYPSRLISHLFRRAGRPVVRFSHGGDRGLMADWRWHPAELAYSDDYVLHGAGEANAVRSEVEKRTTALAPETLNIHGAGSEYHRGLVERGAELARTTRKRPLRRVVVVSAAFSAFRRPVGLSKPHDIVYLNWLQRLVGSLSRSGLEVTVRRHPKEELTGLKVMGNVPLAESSEGIFADLYDEADAFVFDFAASAFMEALCSLKPVVLISFPFRPMRPEAIRGLGESCAVVPGRQNGNNQLEAEWDLILDGLSKEVDLTARQTYVEDQLLKRTPGFDELLASFK